MIKPDSSRSYLNQVLTGALFAMALSPLCLGSDSNKELLEAPILAMQMPEVTVSGQFHEDALSGPYNAPEWTNDRRFTTTRIYLQQQGWGQFGFEQWYRGRYYRDGTAENKFEEEIEIGLPYRFQLDLYENWVTDEHRRSTQDEASIELRWALADWGKIPLNPTLYAEYAFVNDDPDTIEVKLLLGDNFGPRWHWGANFSCEQEVTGAHSTELLFAQGISYTLIDQKLDAGIEMEFIDTSEQGDRHDPSVEFQMGPSIQWRPTSWSHLDIVPLVGMTKDSPRVECFIVFGIDFGPGRGKEGYTPAALGSH